MSVDGITFQAVLYRISTTVDGGWSITFHAPNNASGEVLKLGDVRDQVLQLAVIPTDSELPDLNDLD